MHRPERRWPVRVLLVLGAVFAGLGLVAGYLNREVLDGPTFAANVDEVRRDPAVAAEVGDTITSQLVAANPDLVALRPLVEAVATRVAGGSALSGPVQRAAREAHAALTDPGADSAVLRLADAGAVVAGAIALVAPERAPNAQAISVTLAELGGQSYASTTIAIAHVLGVLAWLLPLLAAVCLVGAVVCARDRWLAAAHAGLALVGAAAGVGLVLAVGGVLVRRVDDDTLGGALARAGWQVFARPLWWGVLVLALAGAGLAAAAGAAIPGHVVAAGTRVRAWATRRPASPAAVVLRGLVFALVGLGLVLDPLGLLELAGLTGGVVLVLVGLAEISRAAEHARAAREVMAEEQAAATIRRDRRWLPVAGAAVLVLLLGAAWLARPGRDAAAAPPIDESAGCNGHLELCDRRFDEVAYVASHNSMSVASLPGWFIPEQSDPIPVQLDQGVRALLIDVWAGRPAANVVRTAPGSYAEAAQVVSDELGPEVVEAARRIGDSVAGVPEGPEALYLCHGLCETGSTRFADVLQQVRAWLVANPQEILTLFIEDHVAADRIAADIEAAGLVPFTDRPVVGEPFPTLREMVETNRRLVVMLEEGNGGEQAPWLVNGFELTQDTPYTFPSAESFSCDANRGPAGAPLFLVNHWLSGFGSLVTNAQQVNALDVLQPRAQQCEEERGQIPNFVAVNYTAIGDVNRVVDHLNGVGEDGTAVTTTATG